MAEEASSSSGVQNMSKKSRSEKTVDRISKFPDSLICQILSFLPVNEAVGTSVLSSRWRHLWTLVPALLFHDKHVNEVFVDRFMDLYRLPCIKKFCLALQEHHDPSRVNAWICSAFMHKVEELLMFLDFEMNMKLPPNPNYCKNLVVLKLCGQVTLDFPPPVSFPSLKILHFLNLSYLSGDSLEQIFSGSPRLESFFIFHKARIFHGKQTGLCMRSSSLKKLEITTGGSFESPLPPREDLLSNIDAPKVEFLRLSYVQFTGNFKLNLSSLIEADIGVFTGDAKLLVELLRQISNVKNHSEAPNHKFHTLGNLTHLDVSYQGNELWILPRLLKCSPNLEFLVVRMGITSDVTWYTPEVVPQCMLCLKMVEFTTFEGCEKDMEMVEYFLKNSIALEKLVISDSFAYHESDQKQCDMVKRLTMFPKVSSKCQIVVS